MLSYWKKYENKFILLFFMIAFGGLSLWRGQPQDWDLLDYHFYNGFAFIHWRYFHDLSPAMVQSHLNPFFDVINYFLITTQPASLIVFEQGTITGISAFILYRMAHFLLTDIRPPQRRWYALVAVAIGATAVGGLSTLGLMFNDNKAGLMAIFAIYAVMKGLLATDGREQGSWIFAAGLTMGLVTGFKLVTGCYAIGFGVAILLCRRPDRRHLTVSAMYCASTLLGFVLANGFWMYYWYIHYANPFFPYYNDLFRSPYIGFDSYKDGNFQPKHFWTLPFYWAFKKKAFQMEGLLDTRPLVLYILTFAALLAVAWRSYVGEKKVLAGIIKKITTTSVIWRFVVIGFVVSYVIWYEAFTIHRYLIPLELLMGVFIVSLTYKLVPWEKARFGALAAFLVLFAITSRPSGWGLIRFKPTIADMTRDFFVVSKIPQVPDSSVILINGDAPSAYLIPYFPESVRFIGTYFVFDKVRDPEQKALMVGEGQRLMDQSAKSLYILTGSKQLDPKPNAPRTVPDFLQDHNLKIIGECQKIESNMTWEWIGDLQLCQVSKKT